MADINCAHEECECNIQDGKGVQKDGETYCSSYCSQAGQSKNSDECKCGHQDCQ